jgi:hypothetical protein
VLVYGILLHLIWGATILWTGEDLHTTALDSLRSLVADPRTDGIIYVSVAALTAYGLYTSRPLLSLFAMFPQQILLTLSAFGAIQAILRGSFADGVSRPGGFIFVDQLPAILIALVHTANMIDYHRGGKAWTVFR